MTKVTELARHVSRGLVVAGLLCLPAMAASTPAPLPAAPESHPAQQLYSQLSSVGLDKTRIYVIRDASLDRAALHFTLEDGTIAFTEDVAGHVTGAFFQGEGEVLLIPPGQVERGSMILFTGGTILEEQFETAYFRFNDDTFAALQKFLHPADDASDFYARWNEPAKAMAQADALRLFTTFSETMGDASSAVSSASSASADRLLHAHLQGRKLGGFDIYYDSRAPEQIWAGQLRTVNGQNFYDVWTSFAVSAAARSSEAVSSTTGQDGPVTAIHITSYQIKAEVKPPTELDADAILRLQVHDGGMRTVLFELSRFLQVKEVRLNGEPVEFIHNQSLEGTQLSRRGNDVVAVVFPQPLKKGQEMEVQFSYGGDVISQAGPGLLYVGERGNWYPNLGMSMADFDLEFSYPAGWTLLATGKQTVAPDKPHDGEQISRWVSERLIPFAGFNLGKYARAGANAHGVDVEAYATYSVEKNFPKQQDPALLPSTPDTVRHPGGIAPSVLVPSPARTVQTVAENAADAINFFSGIYGPYPFTDLKITQMPGAASQGWPGLIFLSTYVFLTDAEKAQIHFSPVERTMTNLTVAHETAHEWWGDLVSWNGYRDQWLIEALANYSAMLMLRQRDPTQFRAVLDKYRDDLFIKQQSGAPLMNAGPVTLGVRLSSSKFPAGYEAISYGRGTWLFFMLDSMISDGQRLNKTTHKSSEAPDETFTQALHRICTQYAGKTLTTKDVLAAFEPNLPPSLRYERHNSLDWFYDNWINGEAIPHFELSKVHFGELRGKNIVKGTITVKDAPDNLVTPVPVYALAPKKVIVGQVFVDESEVQFTLEVPAGTQKIGLDPDHTLLTSR